MHKLRIYFLELEERLRTRSPASRVAFGGLLGFAVTAPFSISLAQICVFTALVAWLASMTKAAPLLTQKFPLWGPWLLFALFTLASAFHVPDSSNSLIKTRELTQIMIFYLAMNIVRDDWEALWLVKVLFVATSVAAFVRLGRFADRNIFAGESSVGFFQYLHDVRRFSACSRSLGALVPHGAQPGKQEHVGLRVGPPYPRCIDGDFESQCLDWPCRWDGGSRRGEPAQKGGFVFGMLVTALVICLGTSFHPRAREEYGEPSGQYGRGADKHVAKRHQNVHG